jgi:hypothetical protein
LKNGDFDQNARANSEAYKQKVLQLGQYAYQKMMEYREIVLEAERITGQAILKDEGLAGAAREVPEAGLYVAEFTWVVKWDYPPDTRVYQESQPGMASGSKMEIEEKANRMIEEFKLSGIPGWSKARIILEQVYYKSFASQKEQTQISAYEESGGVVETPEQVSGENFEGV